MQKVLLTATAIIFSFEVSLAYADYRCADYLNVQSCSNSSIMFDQCDREIIRAYTGNLYSPLNKHLRGIQIDSDCIRLSKSLENALLKLPKIKKQFVYRLAYLTKGLRELQVGGCFSDLAFLSTSKSREYIPNPRDGYTVLQIKTHSGRSIEDYAYARQEEEVLLLPNTPLKLMNLIKNTNNEKIIYKFKEVEASECIEIKH